MEGFVEEAGIFLDELPEQQTLLLENLNKTRSSVLAGLLTNQTSARCYIAYGECGAGPRS